jgi:hypothetical protein
VASDTDPSRCDGEVEGNENRRALAGAKQIEVRNATLILDDHFPVDDCRLARQVAG